MRYLSENIDRIKEEVAFMIQILNQKNKFKNTDKLRSILKKYILLKKVLYNSKHSYYVDCLMEDLLYTIYFLNSDSEKTFYICFRSFIENSVRVILEKSDSDQTGIRNLFKELKEFSSNHKIYSYMNGEYGKCCDYVHSNINANRNIIENYRCISEANNNISNDDFAKKIELYLNIFVMLIIQKKCYWVHESYRKNRRELEYLLGEKLYNTYKLEDQKYT